MHDRAHLLLIGLFVAVCIAPSASADELTAAIPAATLMLGTDPGQMRDDNGLAMKLVWCPPGRVLMNQVDGEPEHGEPRPVIGFLTRGYWLGKYEVTQRQWKRVAATEPWKNQSETKAGDDFPATFVTWKDAADFCEGLTRQERAGGRLPDGWEYTLPTEAQWVRACRARTETKFSFGDDESKLVEYAWCADAGVQAVGESYAHRVGQKKPNPWGFYDMHGNVWEWCRDAWTETMPGGRDPEVIATDGNAYRVLRGAGWNSLGRYSAAGFHSGIKAATRASDIGFRVALTVVRTAPGSPAK